MNKFLIVGVVALVLIISGSWWTNKVQESDPNVISTKGIHWHPELEIYVEGEQIEIPENIGLIEGHSPIHTHEDTPTVHLEFEDAVSYEDIKLSKFLDTWGKDINEFGGNLVMTVNGEVNTDLGEYIMRDGDKIVLRYE